MGFMHNVRRAFKLSPGVLAVAAVFGVLGGCAPRFEYSMMVQDNARTLVLRGLKTQEGRDAYAVLADNREQIESELRLLMDTEPYFNFLKYFYVEKNIPKASKELSLALQRSPYARLITKESLGFSPEHLTVENIEAPEWFLNVPMTGSYFFASGFGASDTRQTAYYKAIPPAKQVLAYKIQIVQKRPDKLFQYFSDGSDLTGYEIAQSQITRTNAGIWQVFILLRYDLNCLSKSC